MKKILAKLLCAAMVLALFVPAFIGVPATAATAKTADTKYPVLLVHGAGFRDKVLGIANYWGRIPKALEDAGAKVYYGGTDGWGEITVSAGILKKKVESILKETGAEKVNIIAHSKGGIECRYMISSLNMGAKVASLTTISTPHRGVKAMDIYMDLPSALRRVVSWITNFCFVMMGDRRPDFYNGAECLSPAYMTEFNKKNPNVKGVYYQSYAGRMSSGMSDVFMAPPHALISYVEGDYENDGLVPISSAKWGTFQGIIEGVGTRGVSHAGEVDYTRLSYPVKIGSKEYADTPAMYADIVAGLKQKGY